MAMPALAGVCVQLSLVQSADGARSVAGAPLTILTSSVKSSVSITASMCEKGWCYLTGGQEITRRECRLSSTNPSGRSASEVLAG